MFNDTPSTKNRSAIGCEKKVTYLDALDFELHVVFSNGLAIAALLPAVPVSPVAHVLAVVQKQRASGRSATRKEMFYLTTHSTHFIYGYMASDIWLRIILIVRKPHK